MEQRFGRRPGFPLGIEEELLLVDAETLRPANVASELVARVRPTRGTVTNDLYEALIECSTPVVESAAEGLAHLAETREALHEAGAALIGGGLHPDAAFGDVEHVALERYETIHTEMRGLVSRTPTAAVHVHVGMPDAETAIAVYNALRAHLPLLQALAAHSPYWHGRDSGLASARAVTFRAFPRSTIPPPFASFDEYAELVRWCERAAAVPDYTYLWWDVRPSPNLGTVEVRAMDAQARLESTGGLAALIHALAVAAAHGAREQVPPTEALKESSFRAARDGVDATIWWRGAMRPIREVGADALALARPYARELGGEELLTEVERILREGGGAERMRAAHAGGGMRAVLASLRDETYASTQTTSP